MAIRGGLDSTELTVSESPHYDVGSGRARIDEATRQILDVELEEPIEIVGKRTTVATVRRIPQEDEGKKIIRIDGLVRSNAQVSLGDKVVVKRAEVHPAQETVFAPIIPVGHKIAFGEGIENFVRRGLVGRAMTKGDAIIVPGIAQMGGAVPFMVVRTKPGGNVRIVNETAIAVREQAFYKSEELSPEDRYKFLVDRVVENLSDLLAEFGEVVGALEGDIGEKARALVKKVRELLEDIQGKDDE